MGALPLKIEHVCMLVFQAEKWNILNDALCAHGC
jgi:hypothetical protein